MQIVPWSSNPSWSQDIVLGDNSYNISGKYNVRDLGWYIDIIDNNDLPLVIGRKIVIGADILDSVIAESRPDGILFVFAVTEGIEEVTRDNMGVDVQLVFIESDEVL